MANFGFIVERQIQATDVATLSKSATCATNVDGGNLVTVGAYEGGSYTATLGTAGAATGFWMAYNPTEHLTNVNGKLFSGLSADPRDYTNLATRQFDIFKPQVEDIIGFTVANLTNPAGAVAVGNFLEPDAAGKLQIVTNATPTSGTTSFKVVSIDNQPFPQAGIGQENAKLYTCVCVAN